MKILNISVPDEMKTFIEAQIAAGGNASAGEFACALIRDAQEREAREELESKLLEGLQGPMVEMTAEEWDSTEQEAAERLAPERPRT